VSDGVTTSPLARTQAVYRRSAPFGPTLLYSGQVRIRYSGGEFVHAADVRLEQGAAGPLVAFLAGDNPQVHDAYMDRNTTFDVVGSADLEPTVTSSFSEADLAAAHVQTSIRMPRCTVGELTAVTSFVIHIAARFDKLRPSRIDGVYLAGVEFALPGWRLSLVQLEPPADGDFTHIVNAVPDSSALADPSRLDDLRWQLHVLLGFIAGQVVSIGPVVGMDDTARVRWADWAAGRRVPASASLNWCTLAWLPQAVGTIADGLASLDADVALRRAVDRAVNYYMSASGGDEVLDLRVPIACLGLETLGWAVLQRGGWIGRDALNKMSEGGVARILLRSLGIPTEVPAHLTALTSHLRAVNNTDWGGPEIVFKVRNQLMHAPKNIESPEWPNGELLVDAWRLATWYLEMALLATAGYRGRYQSRLHLGGWSGDLQPVPWASPPEVLGEEEP